MDLLDAVLYINLAHRTDRKDNLLRQLRPIFDSDELCEAKVRRVEAVRHEPNGALGCGLSHIKALETVWENRDVWTNCVLILEDDFEFCDRDKRAANDELGRFLNTLNQHEPDYDVAVVHTHAAYRKLALSEKIPAPTDVRRLLGAASTAAYVVRTKYVPTLLATFKECMADMAVNGRRHETCIDQYWQRLMPRDKWFTIYPQFSRTYYNYSDIEKRVMVHA